MKKLCYFLIASFLSLMLQANTNSELDSLYIKLRMARSAPGNALANAYSDLGDYYMYKVLNSEITIFWKDLSHMKEKTAPISQELMLLSLQYETLI